MAHIPVSARDSERAGRDIDSAADLTDCDWPIGSMRVRDYSASQSRCLAVMLVFVASVCMAVLAGSFSGAGSVRTTQLLGVRRVKSRDWLSAQTRYAGGTPAVKSSLSHARVSYAGIVPYEKHRARSRPRAVACGGGSSVACVLSAAEQGIHSAMTSKGTTGPGKLAVEQAAKGKGFAPWDVSHQSKTARQAARRAVAASSGHGQGRLPLHPVSNTHAILQYSCHSHVRKQYSS